jgi:hypothetical protein
MISLEIIRFTEILIDAPSQTTIMVPIHHGWLLISAVPDAGFKDVDARTDTEHADADGTLAVLCYLHAPPAL